MFYLTRETRYPASYAAYPGTYKMIREQDSNPSYIYRGRDNKIAPKTYGFNRTYYCLVIAYNRLL